MALLTFLPHASASSAEEEPKKQTSTTPKRQQQKQRKKKKQQQPHPSSSSWDQIKNLLTCKQIEGSRVHDPSKPADGSSKPPRSCSSICSFGDVVRGNTRVVHRPDNSPEKTTAAGRVNRVTGQKPVNETPSSRSLGKGVQFRKLSGCYECHTIVDPTRYPGRRTTACGCSECGEVFPKIESLELHQAVKHAVSELSPDDSSRNIVEIIFKSSWLKKDNPICKIERILKVHNTRRTIQRFEDCRDEVKIRALGNTKKNPRCAADGNELLRFHCTTLTCALGARGSSSLCGSAPSCCGVCAIIRHGFQGKGVRTSASSGRAHDCLDGGDDHDRRAMMVCRVIAGRVRRVADDAPLEEDGLAVGGSYDSVARCSGSAYSNLEEIYVSNPRAILPCFVVIYKALVS